MQGKSKNANRAEGNLYTIPHSAPCSEPWWNTPGYPVVSSTMMRGNTSDSSSLEQSVDGQSQSDGGVNEEDDDAAKQSQNSIPPRPDKSYAQEGQNFQRVAPAMTPRNDDSLMQSPQLELVGHSIACAPNPYMDPYYGGMMAAYGQPMSFRNMRIQRAQNVPDGTQTFKRHIYVPPHLLDVHHARMPLPLEMAQEPVYVNAKQYHGILRRRQSRAKAELEKKLIKVRKPYLHESRHQHALRRARGTGGRFAKKSDTDGTKATGSGSAISPQSVSSSGSEPLHSTTEFLKSHEAKASEDHPYVNGRNKFGNHKSLQESTYQPAERGEGSSSAEQWGNVKSNHALAMQ